MYQCFCYIQLSYLQPETGKNNSVAENQPFFRFLEETGIGQFLWLLTTTGVSYSLDGEVGMVG